MTAKRAQSRRAGKESGAVAATEARWPADAVERRPVAALVPFARNARTHSDEQVAQIAASIREWGWTMPVLVDEAGTIIAGHGRVLAAQRLGLAAADGFIAALPRGYDTPLGEHGETLSGGQVQRLALARAFLKQQAGLLLLDEGTAGLDRGTEAAVADAIRRLAAGRTTLIVTHRLATVGLADRVVFLDEGRIVEQGPRAALQADDGRFARLLSDAGLAP